MTNITIFLLQQISVTDVSLIERYMAAMVLSGVGNALGYKDGQWEFCSSGKQIHAELKMLGGLSNLKVECKYTSWR